MMAKADPRRPAQPAAPAAAHQGRWLLLVHQLPASPSNLRVKTWRRLQELGALPVKQSVYALPDSPEAREDFEWLRVEIEDAGGEAVLFAADHVAAEANTDLVEEFRRDRQTAYAALASDLQKFVSKRPAAARIARPRRTAKPASAEHRSRYGFEIAKQADCQCQMKPLGALSPRISSA